MNEINEMADWKEILDRLSAIREQEDYSNENVEYIRTHLQSPDYRVRGGAALAAEGCLFEPGILNLVVELAESDDSLPIRKAAIQSLGKVINEGVMENMEDETGADTFLDDTDEWREIQAGTLRDDYIRVKNLLFSILLDEFEEREVRESALASLSDLGFLPEVRDWIRDFVESEHHSSRLVALHAMGKYPHYWEEELARFLTPQTATPLIIEAISSSYSSQSPRLAQLIVQLLETSDPDILSYALLTLANINRTDGLGEILQKFSLHSDERVRNAARQAIEMFSKKNFQDFMGSELGME